MIDIEAVMAVLTFVTQATAVVGIAYSAVLAAWLLWMKVVAKRERAAELLPRWELFAAMCVLAAPGILASLIGTVVFLGVFFGAPLFLAGGIFMLIVAYRVSQGQRMQWAWFPLGYAVVAWVVMTCLSLMLAAVDSRAWVYPAVLNLYLIGCIWNGWRVRQRALLNHAAPALPVDPNPNVEEAAAATRASALPHTTGNDQGAAPGEPEQPSGASPAAGGHA